MKYRALVSFSGALSMHQGEVRELNSKEIINDLLIAKYIEEVKEEPNKEKELQEEIEQLKNQIEELKNSPVSAAEKIENQTNTETSEEKSEKDVKSEDESKRSNHTKS